MLFSAIPIRDPYKVAHPESVVLLAQPSTIRLCVLVEVIVVAVTFAVSYYYTATTGTTLTKITFEVLDSPYTCSILAPRKDTEELNTKTSTLVAFSSLRYTYDECMTALGAEGYDLCSDDHRTDYFLSLTGVAADDQTVQDDHTCEDLFLSDNYRFCTGSEIQGSVDESSATSSNVFSTVNSDPDYNKRFSNSFYYTNASGSAVPLVSAMQVGEEQSDYILGEHNNIYIVGKATSGNDQSYYLYGFNMSYGGVRLAMTSITNSGAYGLTYGANCVFVYYINANDKKGKVVKYNTTSQTVVDLQVVDCSTYLFGPSSGGAAVRYISFGTDGKLYLMCTNSKVTKSFVSNGGPGNPPAGTYTRSVIPVFQVDPVNLALTETFYLRNTTLVDEGNGTIDMISQVLQVGSGGKLQIIAISGAVLQGSYNQVDGFKTLLMTPYKATISGATNGCGKISDDRIYCTAASQVFHVSNSSITTYPANFHGKYYTATRLQLAYSYQICNGEYTNYTIDNTLTSTFYKQCADKNGVYYQENAYYDIPASCKGAINSANDAYDMLDCPAVANLVTNLIDVQCPASFDTICTASYTDNPPFSCETTTYSSWLTTIGTAFANASGAWSICFIIIKFILRKTHFHFVHDFEYDRKNERYLNRDYEKVHTKDDYIAGANTEVVDMNGTISNNRAKWRKDLVAENGGHGSERDEGIGAVAPDPGNYDAAALENGSYLSNSPEHMLKQQ